MITQIEIDGFKSLSKFTMTLNPGLNVLVGPNGTGKTNIVSFFEFLAHVIESDPAEATSFLGGAGAILRRIRDSHSSMISARVLGCYPLNKKSQIHFAQINEWKDKFISYEFEFTLQYLGSLEPVVFLKQHLRFKRSSTFIDHKSSERKLTEWDFEIEMSLATQELKSVCKVKTLKDVGKTMFPMFSNTPSSVSIPQLDGVFNNLCSATTSLPTALSRFTPIMLPLTNDIAGGRAYNIIPSRVRLPEDSARPPGIASDGSGLATTLYSLKRRIPTNAYFPLFQMLAPGRQQTLKTPALESLIAYFQMANKSIKGVEIKVDSFNNQVQVSFEIGNGDSTTHMPLSLMSDGTLKWITLVTAALTTPSVFSIEEPENYLHPNMQAQCVKILREILFHEDEYLCILMSTHSETLLNNCKPNELIIVDIKDGDTFAYRCNNEAEVSDEIARTGFGLGYYYLNNDLHHE